MRYYKVNFIFILFITGILLMSCLSACRNDKNPPSDTVTDAVEKPARLPEQDNVKVSPDYIADSGIFNPRNNHWYTYQYTADEPREDITAENPVVRSENKQERSGQVATKEVYEITETSRPPLFNKDCLTAANPEQCSNEAVIDWMKYAVARPNLPAAQTQEVVHFVTFIIDQNGNVSKAKIIPARKGPTCKPCQAATLEALAGMPAWLPAIRNAQAVKVQVTLPVYYDN